MSVQATLYNFEDVRPVDFYSELKSSGYLQGCKADILRLLWDLKSHSLFEVKLAGGSQYNARILELRRDGWNIINERSVAPVRSFYRLLNKEKRK